MSMLAEKKKREKWCLNPRGKAWSEDQNKFGQRLMEKMGWKAGEGLGANQQGITDIVKTRVKNDSKGLGFKENGEEWMKTTSEYDSLLDKLASSNGEKGKESQTAAPVSLEDRSKKSRARIHYHKFTRGKDVSRYSEKDLASILGPEVVKVKSEQKTSADYTQNQINKGSLEEYFSKKLKSKEENCDENIEDDKCNDGEDNGIDSKNNLESDPPVPHKKKKRKKSSVEDNLAENSKEDNICNDDRETVIDSKDNLESDPPVPPKKKKKKKTGVEDNLAENSKEDNVCNNDKESLMDSKDNLESDPLKKKKRKKTSAEEDQAEEKSSINCDEDIPKKKRHNVKVEEEKTTKYEESSNVSNFVSEQSIADETEISKKKKKKSKVKLEEAEVQQTELISECMNNEFVNAEDTVSQKKKKSKNKSEKLMLDSSEVITEDDVKPSNINVAASDTTEVVLKKKKKSKEVYQEHEEEPLLNVSVKKEKNKPPKTDEEETAQGIKQVASSKKAEDCIEVLGRKTRLKKINNPCKTATNDSYQTEEFMCFSTMNVSQTAAQKDVNKNSIPMAKPDASMEGKTNMKMTKQSKNPQIIEKVLEKKSKAMYKTKTDTVEDSNVMKCYEDPNSEEANVPKHVVAYEYRLVVARLKHLEISPPKVKITIEEEKNLNPTIIRKLRQIGKIKQFKTLLAPKDKTEIETLVSKFYENLKPKIEMMTSLGELEEKVYKIAKNLEGNLNPTENENVSTIAKEESPENVDSLKSQLQKLENLFSRYRTNNDESNTSKDNTNKEGSDADDTAGETDCMWLKKAEKRLETLKENQKLLSEGKIPPNLTLSVEPKKVPKKKKKVFVKVVKKPKKQYNEKHDFKNTSYSRGRVAHNVRNQRGRGGIKGVQSAIPHGGWGVLKSFGTDGQELPNRGQNTGGSGGEGYGGGFFDESMWRGRGTGRGVMGRGRGDFVGRGRGHFMGRGGGFMGPWGGNFMGGRGNFMGGRGNFVGQGGSNFMGRGRGAFRGRGRGDVRRGRGRISQNNFEAKLYAEKCKELNKVPEVCFNGVNLKLISGYAANVTPTKTTVLSNTESKSSGSQPAISNSVTKPGAS
ncbi:nucleolin-like isoform X1 [Macrosteles quadrilineatus]|uniref:nucleolin-like isoform X1 n=2 Tax=Macrosteles quadrilineatus TaxID=74068 RepID=UPI0023E28F7E|nr:nucleolin-like isoform X1 [Macrosteles quadrilineatus]